MTRRSDSEGQPRYSGQLRLRMPAGLHRDIANAAAKEGVSMNQFMCTVLAVAVGWTAIALEEKKRQADPSSEDLLPLGPSVNEIEEFFSRYR